MALGILIKTQRRIWFEVYLRLGALTKSQNKPAGLDSKRVVLRVFSFRKEPAFSVHSTAVLVGRANKPRWARAVKLRGFLFFSLLRRSFARAFAAQWCARQNRHATQAADISRRHQRFPRGTGNS